MEVGKEHWSQHSRDDPLPSSGVLGKIKDYILMDKKLLCSSLACFNLNVEILTQWIVSLILQNGRVNQGQGLNQSSTSQFRALIRHALKNMRQCVGNYIIGPSCVLDAKFKRGQSQHPPAKPTYVFNTLEKPA